MIEDFCSDSIQATEAFEASTKGDDTLYQSDDDEEEEEDQNQDVCDTFFKVDQDESHEPLKSTETDWTHNQTTMIEIYRTHMAQ